MRKLHALIPSLILCLVCGCASLPSGAPVSSPSPSAETPLPTSTQSAPSPTANPTAPTPTATVNPTATLAPVEWVLIYRQGEGQTGEVAGVFWQPDSRSLRYALAGSSFLLDWYEQSLDVRQNALQLPRDAGYSAFWRNAQVGYPVTRDPCSELQGYVAQNYGRALFPNAGFPQIRFNPNFVYLILSGDRDRQMLLGPTYPGAVQRAVWMDRDKKVLFDYVTEDRTILYLHDLGENETWVVHESLGKQVEWALSPDNSQILVPNGRESVLIHLDQPGWPRDILPISILHPVWSADSVSIYTWNPMGTRLIRVRSDGSGQQRLLAREQLPALASSTDDPPPLFTVSPDGKWAAFFTPTHIWGVRIP